MDERVARAVRRGAGARYGALAEVAHVSTKRPLVDPSIIGPRERHSSMIELHHGGDSLPAHVLDCVLVAEPIGAFDRVVHVPSPVILTGGCPNSPLSLLARQPYGCASGTLW